MSFARVGIFLFQEGTSEDVIQKTQERACAYLQTLPGFLSYRAVLGRMGQAASLSEWSTLAQAQEAERRMDEWIRRSAQSLLVSSNVFVGEVSVEEEGVDTMVSKHADFPVPEARH
jgi:hypothetical protein